MRVFVGLVIALGVLGVSSCATFGGGTPPPPPLTPVEIEQLQSRTFASSADSVFKATLGALQGLGYIIDNANMQAGFLSATTPRQVVQANGDVGILEGLLAALIVGAAAGLAGTPTYPDGHVPADKITRHVRLSANARQRGSETILRISLVEVINRAGGRGQHSGADAPIHDGQSYEKIFQRIEDELFVFEGLPTQEK